MTDELNLPARTLAALIRSKEVSPVEVVNAALDRIDLHANLNAFITVIADQAVEAAKVAEQQVVEGKPLGALHGVPYTVKDLTTTAGVRTTMGSLVYQDYVPDHDAVAVARSKSAGAILLGKTTTPEFGAKQSTDAPIFGRTLNPIDPSVTCGASSGGAAVAVATGMGAIALGTDGGGSIRIPASCCGIVGLKPTLGNIPSLQPADLFSANSYVGPMARDIADTRLFYEVLQGGHARDPWGLANSDGSVRSPYKFAGLKGLRVAYMPSCGNRVHSQVKAATDAVALKLQSAGAMVEEVELDFVSFEQHFLVILQSLNAARVQPFLEEYRSRLDPSLVAVVEKGLQHSAIDLHRASSARTQCFQQLQSLFEQYDVLLSPTVSAPPLPVNIDPNGIIEIEGQPAGTIRGAWYPYTYPMNLTGHPALSMPCGTTPEGLPIGMQLCGPWYSDRFLLDVAESLEAIL